MSRPLGQKHLNQQGFSLIELIITLMVFGILASMLVTVMGTSLTSSGQPIIRLQQTMQLQMVMENIRAEFKRQNDLGSLDTTNGISGFDTFKDTIGATGSLQTSNNFGKYGDVFLPYEVIAKQYIKFGSDHIGTTTGATETDGILQVTLKEQSSGLTLTELFVKW